MAPILRLALTLTNIVISCYCFAQSTDVSHLSSCDPSTTHDTAFKIVKASQAWSLVNNVPVAQLSHVIVGIIDTGVLRTHPEFTDLAGNPNVSIIPPTPQSFSTTDTMGHGTSVVGIIGANNLSAITTLDCVGTHAQQMNGVVAGTESVNYTLYVVGSSLTFRLASLFDGLGDDFITLVNRLGQERIPVVNLSFAVPARLIPPLPFTVLSNVLRNTYLRYPGTLFVVAAGDAGGSVQSYTPANLYALSNVLTVGGSSFNDGIYRRQLSNGQTIESPSVQGIGLSAPGEVWAPSIGPEWGNFVGTSASAALVAGAAGLVKSVRADLDPPSLKKLLIDSGDNTVVGKRLNVCRAVKQALSTPDPPPPQLLSPANNVVLPPNLSGSSGPAYAVPLRWSNVAPQACNGGIGYQLAVSNNGHTFSGTSLSGTSFNLTISSPPPSGVGLTGWAWIVTAVDQFGNKTQSGSGSFSLQPPSTTTPADLAIAMTAIPGPTVVGGSPLTYTITVQNATGVADAQNVTVTDTLPFGFVSCSVSVGGCSGANGTVTALVGTLTGGATATLTINASSSMFTSNPAIDVATVTTTSTEPNTANNTVSVSTNIVFPN